MKIHILNRVEFEHLLVSKYDNFMNVANDKNSAYISIHNFNDDQLLPNNYSNYANFWFDDVTDNDIHGSVR